MSINIYTCTQADLETLEGIGPKSAADIIAVRNEVLAGTRPKLTINHLAAVRLQYDTWQAFIDEGKLSITFHAAQDEEEAIQDKHPMMKIPTTELQTEQTMTMDNLVISTTTLTGQTVTVTNTQNQLQQLQHDPEDMSPGQAVHDYADSPLQDSVVMLAQQVDQMVNQINGLGSTLSKKLNSISDTVTQLQQQNTNMQWQLHHQDKSSAEMQKKLSVHDTFMADISKWLPPPVPISEKLPIFKKLNQFQATTLPSDGKLQMTPLTPQVNQFATPAKPIVTQPSPFAMAQTSLTLPLSTSIPQDVKPKHPQQALIDNITAKIPKSAIFSTVTNPSAAPLPQVPLTIAQLSATTNTNTTFATIDQSIPVHQNGQPSVQTTATEQPTASITPTGQTETQGQTSSDRGRSRRRKSRSRRGTSNDSSSRSYSPPPPRLQLFSGDPASLSWSSFFMKFDRIARRKGWSDDKKLDRLYDCLTDKALEYAARSDNKDNYDRLTQELALRFDLKDEPIAARQRLYLAKQDDDETLEAFLQRILTITMDGHKNEKSALIQQVATESFLRGCKHKDAATTVMNESPATIHDACKRIKTILANKKAIGGSKVSFQERQFTVAEETRVAGLEKKVDDLTKTIQKSSPFYRSPSGSPSRYSSGPQGQNWQRQRSPDYYRGGSPGGGRPYDGRPYDRRSPSRRDGSYSNNYQRSPSRESGYPPAQYFNSGYPPPQYSDGRGYPTYQGYSRSPQRYPPGPQGQSYGYQNQPPPWPYRDKDQNRSPQRNREAPVFSGSQPSIRSNPDFSGSQPPNRQGPDFSGSLNQNRGPPGFSATNPFQAQSRPRSPEAYARVSQSVQDLNMDGLGQPTTNT